MAPADARKERVLVAVAPEQQSAIGDGERREPGIRARRPMVDRLVDRHLGRQELAQPGQRLHRVRLVAAVEPDQRALTERELGPFGLRAEREVARDDDQARRLLLPPGVLGQRGGELREVVPARRARCDQDREAALVDRTCDLLELRLTQAVVGTCAVLPLLETKLAHHSTVDPRVIGRRVANMQDWLVEIGHPAP